MAINDRNYIRSKSDVAQINSFATQVYGWMAFGLALTALVAWFVFASGMYKALLNVWWITMIATFAITMAISKKINALTFSGLASLFMGYCAVEGIFFGTVLPVFASAFGGQVIWSAFATAAIVFTLAVGYGMFSKSDLTSLGRILSIAVMGLVLTTLLYMVLSFFMPMQKMMLLISYVGLIVFVGLTAYDSQRIRMMSEQVDGSSAISKKLSLIAALRMYANIIMVFWYLLQIFSSSSRR